MKIRINYLDGALSIAKYLSIYYLSAKMICFAIPKFLFMQFRILHYSSYVPLVEVSKAEHMWSFFGRSYHYNLFIGLAELLIGVLVVFKRTRLIALLISFAVCANILILNIEFEIFFALQHVILDLIITILLLSDYYKHLYRFFFQLGGKLDQSIDYAKNGFKKYFPYIFVITVFVSYLIFAFQLRSGVNEEVVGAYEIKKLQIAESEIGLKKGSIAKQPMIFLEYNNQVVISINDSLFKGSYSSTKDSIKLYFRDLGGLNMKRMQGIIKGDSIIGRTEDGSPFGMTLFRLNKEQNYLNELYR